MFQFDVAMRDASNLIDARTKTRKQAYMLYYSNDPQRSQGTMRGVTIKQLINEFRSNGRNYKFAFITRVGDDTPLRWYNADKSKKFYSLTRKGGKRNKG